MNCHCEESIWTTKQSFEIFMLLSVVRNENVKFFSASAMVGFLESFSKGLRKQVF